MTNTPQPPDPIDEILHNYTITDRLSDMHESNVRCRCIEGAKGHLKVALKKAMISRKAVEEALPVKKKDTTAQDLRSGDYKRGDDEYRKGYNQAISDIRAALGLQKTR